MADLAECKAPTIQAIELGKLNLSARLAQVIAEATGCDLRWLMDNDTSVPIRNSRGNPYTPEDYEDARIAAEASRIGEIRNLRRFLLTEFILDCTRWAKTLVAAVESDSHVRWRYRKELALEKFEGEFWPRIYKFTFDTKEYWDAARKARLSYAELVESNPPGTYFPSMEILERTLAKALRMACGKLLKRHLGKKPGAVSRPQQNRAPKSLPRRTRS